MVVVVEVGAGIAAVDLKIQARQGQVMDLVVIPRQGATDILIHRMRALLQPRTIIGMLKLEKRMLRFTSIICHQVITMVLVITRQRT